MSSRIDQKKALVGFVPAQERHRCGSCMFASEDANWWTCRRHAFSVSAYSVCNDWKSRATPEFKALQ